MITASAQATGYTSRRQVGSPTKRVCKGSSTCVHCSLRPPSTPVGRWVERTGRVRLWAFVRHTSRLKKGSFEWV